MTEKTESSVAAKAAEKAPARKAEPKAPEIRVVCVAKGGRRRGGRAWSEGETMVPASEMTKALRTALTGDPLFIVEG